MNKKEFFERITENQDSVERKIIRILEVRGYIINTCVDKYFLDLYTLEEDIEYLKKSMSKYKIGYLKISDNKSSNKDYRDVEIIIDSDATLDNAVELFEDIVSYYEPSDFLTFDWEHYIFQSYFPQYPICRMDPYVARLTNLIMQCNVKTNLSCDGVDKNSWRRNGKVRYMSVRADYPYSVWFGFLFERIIPNNFNLDIDFFYDELSIKYIMDDKFKAFFQVQLLCDWICENKQRINNIYFEVERYFVENDELVDLEPEEVEKLYIEKCIEVIEGKISSGI